MYPRPYYIRYGHGDAANVWHGEYRQVMITGYTDAISASAFSNLNSNTAYDLSQKVTKNYKPYDYTYHVKHLGTWKTDQQIQKEMSERLGKDCVDKVVGDPIDLMDFYQEIGYDYKKKHFNGKTLRQHVLDCIKEEENDT